MLMNYTRQLMVGFFALPFVVIASSLWADAPGRGATADFEVGYLQFIIDHKYSALRLTEIAAGTDEIRDADINNEEGVAPSPNTEAVEGKASLEVLRSLARKANRSDREGILIAQLYLRDWYGIDYSPQVTPENEAAIQALEEAQPGADFDQLFMETLSRHNYHALNPSLDCIVGRDISHHQLYRFCDGIVHENVGEIEGMRELLFTEYGNEDFQAFSQNDEGTDSSATGNNGSVDEGGDQPDQSSSDLGTNTQPEVVQSDEQTDVL